MINSLKYMIVPIACAWSSAPPLLAEIPDKSPAELEKTATHIVTGQVELIYTRTHQVGHWKYTSYLAEIKVEKVEKGEGIALGQLIYVRYWHRQWTGSSRVPPSTNGYRGLPEENANVRVYVAKNAYDGISRENQDGGYNVVGPNGFEELK